MRRAVLIYDAMRNMLDVETFVGPLDISLPPSWELGNVRFSIPDEMVASLHEALGRYIEGGRAVLWNDLESAQAAHVSRALHRLDALVHALDADGARDRHVIAVREEVARIRATRDEVQSCR